MVTLRSPQAIPQAPSTWQAVHDCMVYVLLWSLTRYKALWETTSSHYSVSSLLHA